MSKLICPVCAEPVVKRPPHTAAFGWALTVERKRLRHSHPDGEPLCSEMTNSGYQPSLPRKA